MPRPRHALCDVSSLIHITACGWEARAFSVSFSVSRSCVKGLIYYDRMAMTQMDAMERGNGKQDGCPAHKRTHASPAPPVPPSSPSPGEQEQAPKTTKQAPKAKNLDSASRKLGGAFLISR